MHPSVGVAAHGVASGDSAGEGGGVPHHNPCESCCDLHLWWYCSGGRSERVCRIIVDHRFHESSITWKYKFL